MSCKSRAELVESLLPGALEALRDRRLQAGEPVAAVADDAGLAERREELVAVLDAAMGAYVDVGLRQLLLAGMWRATCAAL